VLAVSYPHPPPASRKLLFHSIHIRNHSINQILCTNPAIGADVPSLCSIQHFNYTSALRNPNLPSFYLPTCMHLEYPPVVIAAPHGLLAWWLLADLNSEICRVHWPVPPLLLLLSLVVFVGFNRAWSGAGYAYFSPSPLCLDTRQTYTRTSLQNCVQGPSSAYYPLNCPYPLAIVQHHRHSEACLQIMRVSSTTLYAYPHPLP